MPSVSISLNQSRSDGPCKISFYISADGGDTLPTPSVSDLINHPHAPYPVWQPITIEKAFMADRYDILGRYSEEAMSEIDPTILRVDQRGSDGVVREVASKWSNLACSMLVNVGFVRFFEVWGKGTQERIMQGLLGTNRIRQSLSGKLGANNNAFNKDNKFLERGENGEWRLVNKEVFSHRYNYVRRLPEEGIRSMRECAYRLRTQRQG